jgi:hypothetical protein
LFGSDLPEAEDVASALGGDPNDVALGICEDAKRHARYLLSRLDRLPAELLCSRERCLDVLDADEEQHRIIAALQRADRSRKGSFDAWIDERVARERPIGVRPTEQLGEESTSRVGVLRTDLGVDDGVSHEKSLLESEFAVDRFDLSTK